MHPGIALRRFALMLEPHESEMEAARGHFHTIRSRLNQALGLRRIIPIGSHARGTAIRTYSDIDFLAVLPRQESRWGDSVVTPESFLSKVARELRGRYTVTSIRCDGQAVVLAFQGGAHAVDLVPGIFLEMHESRPLYAIPGTADKWIRTSPETHDRIFKNANFRTGGKLGKLSKLVKAWRYGRTPAIALSSFYVDLLLATTDIATGVKSYSACLTDFFREILRREARGLRDPAAIGGVIQPVGSENARHRLQDAASYALDHAEAALTAERRRKYSEAVRQWEIVFNQAV